MDVSIYKENVPTQINSNSLIVLIKLRFKKLERAPQIFTSFITFHSEAIAICDPWTAFGGWILTQLSHKIISPCFAVWAALWLYINSYISWEVTSHSHSWHTNVNFVCSVKHGCLLRFIPADFTQWSPSNSWRYPEVNHALCWDSGSRDVRLHVQFRTVWLKISSTRTYNG